MFQETENIKRLWKAFIFFFLLAFLIINWSDVSRIFTYFNYRVVYASITEPSPETLNNEESYEDSDFRNADKEKNTIEIPKIGIEAPIVFLIEKTERNSEDFEEALKKGVLYYPDSTLPGEKGTGIILGHSAPPEWPKINYDWVFTDLNKLEAGDIIHLYFNQHQYDYKVRNKFFLEKGEDIPSFQSADSKSVLILLSCWPPGKDQKRIAVEAILE